jgi:hypothetical protein
MVIALLGGAVSGGETIGDPHCAHHGVSACCRAGRVIIMRRMSGSPTRRQFSLDEATRLLPSVKLITAEAVREAEQLSREIRLRGEAHPQHDRLSEQLDAIVSRWAARLQDLQVEAKGLWLVDFDNGDGYYCWQYPEETIAHYHGYDDGFAGRMKIV